MQRRNSIPRVDLRQIFFIGLCFMVTAYVLQGIADAVVRGDNAYRHIFFPESREVALRVSCVSILFLFILYVVSLLLKRRRLEGALVKYQAGMDASIDGICILNSTYDCVYSNSANANLHGYRSHAEIIGQSWRLMFPDDEIRRLETEILPTLFEKGSWCGEAAAKKKDGTIFPLEISLTPIDHRSIVCITRDITERKNFERILERKNLELSATNSEVEAFSYSLTHDLRNHLTCIYSAAQILQDQYQPALDERGNYLVKVIGDTTEGIEDLINDMLVLSRIIRSEIKRETTDVGQMVREIAAQLRLAEPERSVEFTVASGLLADCDPHLLRVALNNLIGNAWKYTGRNAEGSIEFGMVEVGGKKTFFVRDNGVGFDMKDADKLFEPFQRLESAKVFSGSGIGLTTVRRIIERHSGGIKGIGELGKGSTFYFTLG